jgi:hypothetical protein
MVGTPDEEWGASWRWDLLGLGWVSINRRRVGRLELSLPHRRYGGNRIPVGAGEVMDILIDAFTEVAEVVEVPQEWIHPDRLGVSRVDLAHDFYGITDIAAVLRCLHRIPQRRGVDRDLHSDGGGPVAETLTVSTDTAYRVNLYNKDSESGTDRPAGHLRFEAQLRRPRLQKGGYIRRCGGPVEVVADLTDGIMERMAKAMFEELHFDRVLIPHSQLADRIDKIDNLSDRDKVALAGHLLWLEAGRRPPTSDRTFGKFEALANRCGISSAGDDLEVPLRLDWDSATEIRGDA